MEKYTVTLSASDMSKIMEALSALPWREVNPVMAAIDAQVRAQQTPAEAVEE